MEGNYRAAILVLLVITGSLAGCTGPSSAPVATPVAVQPAVTAPAVQPVPATTIDTWTPETPYAGHPYSKTYTFDATGDYDEHTFTTDSERTWVFRMIPPREGDFVVLLQDNNRKTIAVLADTAGGQPGKERSLVLKAGTWYFDVKADAPWTITVSTA